MMVNVQNGCTSLNGSLMMIRHGKTADTLRVGAKDVLNDFNKKWSRKYKLGPKSKRRRSDE